MNVGDLLTHSAETSPDKTAIIFRDQKMNYGELNQRANQVANALIGLGVEKMIVQMVENQLSARRVFERMGFRQEAVLRGHVKDIRGARRDLLVLSNDVSHIWAAMEALMADSSPEVH